MSSQNDDDRGRQGRVLSEIISDIRAEVISLRSQYETERPDVRPQTEEKLRNVTVMYYNALREFRNEDVISQEWEQENGPVQLERLISETATVHQQTPGHGATSEPTELPLIKTVDLSVLVETTRVLDDIANKLGFSAAVNTRRPMYDAGKRDLEDYDEPINSDIPKPE